MKCLKLSIVFLLGFWLSCGAYGQTESLFIPIPPVSIEDFADAKASLFTKELELTSKQRRKVFNIYFDQASKAPRKVEVMVARRVPVSSTMSSTRISETELRRMMRDNPSPAGQTRKVTDGPMYAYPKETEKEIASRNAKMKKILSPDQYEKWVVIEQRMSEREAELQPELLERMQELIESTR